jgi:hypothetical protein
MKPFENRKPPVVITLKSKAKTVARDFKSLQHKLDCAAQADAREGIRQGLEDARCGRLRSIRQFFVEFEARNGISR